MTPKKAIHKAFIEAILNFSTDIEKSRKYKIDKRMTSGEKKIIQAWFCLRDSDFLEGLALAESFQSPDTFVEANRHLIRGLILNNLSKFSEAAQAINTASIGLLSYDCPVLQFVVSYNLSVIAFNLRDPRLMRIALDSLEKIGPQTSTQLHSFLDAKFSLAYLERDLEGQRLSIEAMEPFKHELPEATLMCFLLNKFEYSIQQNDYTACRNVLTEIKGKRKFHFSANYEYMRVILSALDMDQPLYFFEDRFKPFPELYKQIRFLRNLEVGLLNEAAREWAGLRELNSFLYGPDQTYLGPTCLFSLAKDKFSRHRKQAEVPETPSLEGQESKEHHVFNILKTSAGPVSKEQLFKLIYGKEPTSTQDDGRLQKLISRTRQKFGAEILSRRGTFELKSSA